MNEQEMLDVSIVLSRGTQLANKIKLDWEDEDSNGVDGEEAVALADNFLRLRDILISISYDPVANNSTEAV